MGDSAPQELGLSVPLCALNSTSNSSGGACMAVLEPRSFSSTLVLTVVAALLCCLIVLSVVTFHMHKSKIKRRKIQRAQEEYERDHRSPAEAGGGSPPPGRQVMLLLARHAACAPSPTAQREPRPSCTGPEKGEPSCGGSTLESVELSR